MLVDHLPGVVVVALMENLLPGDVHHRAARQGGVSPPAMRGCDQCMVSHGEPLAVAKRRVDGEPALLHVGQQMGKVALNGEQPLMLTKGSLSVASGWYSAASAAGGCASSPA